MEVEVKEKLKQLSLLLFSDDVSSTSQTSLFDFSTSLRTTVANFHLIDSPLLLIRFSLSFSSLTFQLDSTLTLTD